MTADETTALANLRKEAESDNGDGWWDCYIDNARPDGWSGKKWAAVLGSLKKKGLYREVDGYAWGSVKMEGEGA